MNLADSLAEIGRKHGLSEEEIEEIIRDMERINPAELTDENDPPDMEWFNSLPPEPKEGEFIVTTWKKKK